MKNTVLILHEICGVTENLRRLSSLLERQGCHVVLPSLYPDGYSGTNEEYSYNKFFAEVGMGESLGRIDRILEECPRGKIILIGFSIGATLAWLKSTDHRIAGIIGLYGSRIRHYRDIEPLVPARLLFCREKAFDVRELAGELERKDQVSARMIPGDHGFYSFGDS